MMTFKGSRVQKFNVGNYGGIPFALRSSIRGGNVFYLQLRPLNG
jgi:hypothetical protein